MVDIPYKIKDLLKNEPEKPLTWQEEVPYEGTLNDNIIE